VKFFLDMNCQECAAPARLVVHLNAHRLEWKCDQCGHNNSGLFDSTTGLNVLSRSFHELKIVEDYSMCIVLAAMAFEAQLSWLHRKWRGIEASLADNPVDDAALEEELREHRTIAEKIEAICVHVQPLGLDGFVDSTGDLRESLNRFPSLQGDRLSTQFQKKLFWPRNRILHAGYADYSQQDAERCYTIAQFGLSVLHSLDRDRARRLDVALAAEGGPPLGKPKDQP
jgi:hypothetical protein